MKQKKLLNLIITAIKVRVKESILFLRGIQNWRLSFIFSECLIAILYIYRSPYRVSRLFHQQRGDAEIYCFGETPLVTLRKIVDHAKITKQDTVLDAGSGTGRNAFLLNAFTGCKVISIEQIPQFVVKARIVSEILWFSNALRFICGDFLKCEWGDPNVIYLYNFMLSDQEITRFAERCSKLDLGTTFVTVSINLQDYMPNTFKIVSTFIGVFPWGETDVYFQKLLPSN